MKTITIEELEALKDARNFSGGGKPPGVPAGRAI